MNGNSKVVSVLGGLWRQLPDGWRARLAPFASKLRDGLDPEARAKTMWLKEYYSAHGVNIREEIFLTIARFCHINRPIDGYYFEFGSHTGRTMKLCWKHTRHLFDWHYISFDSFEGLPEIEDGDKQQIWEKGRLKTEVEEFRSIVEGAGMPPSRLTTVKGFYDQTLTQELKDKLLPKKAAVVYVDCDLYASTVPVLAFVKDFLQKGTVIVFDDWNCFHADPNMGERRAFREFCESNPDMGFEIIHRTGETLTFVYTGPKE